MKYSSARPPNVFSGRAESGLVLFFFAGAWLADLVPQENFFSTLWVPTIKKKGVGMEGLKLPGLVWEGAEGRIGGVRAWEQRLLLAGGDGGIPTIGRRCHNKVIQCLDYLHDGCSPQVHLLLLLLLSVAD